MKIIKKEYKFKLIISLIFSVLADVFLMQALIGMSDIMDMAIKSNIKDMPITVLLTVFYMAAQWGCTFVKYIFWQRFMFGTRDSLLLILIKSLFRLPMSKLKEKNSDYYMNILNNDIEEFRIGYLGGLYGLLSYSTSVIVAAVTLLRVNYLMVIATVILTILPILISKVMTGKTININKERTTANEVYLSRLQEMVKGFDVVKRSGHSDKYIGVFEKVNKKRSASYMRYSVTTNMIRATMFAIVSINQLILTGLCAFLVVKGMISPGLIIAATAAFANFSDAFSNSLESGIEMKSAKVFLEKFMPYLNKNADDNVMTDTLIQSDNRLIKADIAIEKLNFAYEDKEIFKDFSLNVGNGEIVAVTGESGSGKSTLIKLLLKSFLNYSGKIKYDGKDLQEITEEELYSKVYLVPQESFIFKSSLFDNVTMFVKMEDDVEAKFKEILERVNLRNFMELHKDEELNPDEMSGGEKKRVSIARALFNDSEIIILDEPTSDLDPENKEIINKIIFDMKDKTRIVVTHDWDERHLGQFDKVVRL